MTQRPSAIYPIAVLTLLAGAFALGQLVRWGERLLGVSTEALGLGQVLSASKAGFMIILVVHLIQLKPWARWASVVLLGLAASILVEIPLSALPANAPSLRSIGIAVAGAGVSGVTIWYLLRPSFAKTCERFLAEREAASRRSIVEKSAKRP
jgi:hypothetical protein